MNARSLAPLLLCFALACSRRERSITESKETPAAPTGAVNTAVPGGAATYELPPPVVVDDERGALSGVAPVATPTASASASVATIPEGPQVSARNLRIGEPVVAGPLSTAAVRRVVRQNFRKLRTCYEKALRDNPQLGGHASFSFLVDEAGVVTGARGAGELGDFGVISCMARVFSNMTFPAAPGRATVRAKIPFTFVPDRGPDAALDAPPDEDAAAELDAADEEKPAVPSHKDPEATLAGKPLAEVTSADVEQLLRDVGCMGITVQPPAVDGAATLFTATRDGRTFTLTFIPAGSSAKLPDRDRLRLERRAAIHKHGSFLLAIESDDRAASSQLLDELIKTW
ncbi:MAG: AgmX/PglI C-terminal domain-containing protein [Polyangiaceae bacterium]